MKCPKCKYTSFDFNERCPNCNKDLTRERKAFDLIAFKPNPPYLLGSLTADFRDIGLPLDASSWSVETDTDPEDLDMQLDKEDLSGALPNEEFSLDLADLDSEIGSPEGNALESLDSSTISLDETVPELLAARDIVPPPSSEILTAEIAPETLRHSEDQGA